MKTAYERALERQQAVENAVKSGEAIDLEPLRRRLVDQINNKEISLAEGREVFQKAKEDAASKGLRMMRDVWKES